jgi:DNA-binding NtrC family response regulator
MRLLEEEVQRLRGTDCPVLILGETGTGKTTLARRIHAISSRQAGSFVELNCAGLHGELVESELFGHERGSFTGAHARKTGLLDAAHGGALFLDEIGDIDMRVQPRILKVLDEKRFRRLGDVRERTVDVRLISATHQDLLTAITQNRFRADLYYRVSTIRLAMPPLRERREDIIPLATEILHELASPDVRFDHDALQKLLSYHWPGNIRELKNVIESAVILRSGDQVAARDLRIDEPPKSTRAPRSTTRPSSLASKTTTRAEIEQALAAEGWRVEAAARRLGIPRSTLYWKLKRYCIKAERGVH